MSESLETKVAVIQTDIRYIKKEVDDVKRLQYWLLGLFASLFLLLLSLFFGVVVK